MRFQPLIKWYESDKRDLPWRNTKNPYLIWLSEVILQQTRVDQGTPYYLRIIKKYPNINALARADKDEFLKYWQGLGYYSRAENLLAAAQYICDELNGILPTSYDEWLKIKGVGPYTAAAISSIAFGESKAVLDGNVLRVLSRLFAIKEDILSPSGRKTFHSVANELIQGHNPSLFNQGMMELGALICKPANPLCNECPMNKHCLAYAQGVPDQYPIKKQKNKPVKRTIHFFIIRDKGNIYLQKRSGQSIWKNLYEPPNMESETTEPAPSVMLKFLSGIGLTPSDKKNASISKLYQTKHALTHQQIFATFWLIDNPVMTTIPKKYLIKVAIKDVHRLPVHRLFDKFLNYYNLQN